MTAAANEYCDFTNGSTCPKCNRELHPRAKLPTIRVCRTGPSAARQAWNYTKAVAKWKLAGSPVRSSEEIARIFSICEACPEFVEKGRPHCRLCGCSLSQAPSGLVNKIAMSTEGCVTSPPKW